MTIALVLTLSLVGCSRHDNGSGAAAGPAAESAAAAAADPDAPDQARVAAGVSLGPNKSFARITYRPEVKVIERSGFVGSLVAVSPDGYVLVFHAAPADIHALKAGDVLLIKNELARKVLATEDDGAETYVATDWASIGDLVKEGEINIDAPLIFSAPKSAHAAAPARGPDLLGLLVRSAYAQNSSTDRIEQHAIEQKGQLEAHQQGEQKGNKDFQKAVRKSAQGLITSGWTVAKLETVTAGDVLTFAVVLVKNVQGFIGKVAASGHINNFQFWSNIKVSAGLIESIRTGLNNISGTLQFDWEVAKSTPGSWDLADPVKLPGTLSVGLGPLLGGLPLTLEVSSALLIHPALTGGNQIQTGGFTVTMNGGMSGSIASGGAVAEGSSINDTFQITNDSGISAVAPDAMVIAYAAPRIELQISPFGSLSMLSSIKKASEAYEKYSGKAKSFLNHVAPQLLQQWEQTGGLVFNQVSKILKSKADVYAQLVSTEGVVHAPNISLVPCSKKWIEFSVQVGTAADIAGLTPNAKKSVPVYEKKYSKADPPTDFCEKVGS